MIPSAVIASSPEEFVQLADFYTPIRHVLNSGLCAAGTFIIWFGVFYFLMGNREKRMLESIIWIVSGIAIVDYMFFGTGMGELTQNLMFKNDSLLISGTAFSLISTTERIVNIIVILIIAGFLLLLKLKKEVIVKWLFYIMILAVSGLSIRFES